MLAKLLRRFNPLPMELAGSTLFDEKTFYAAFLKDLEKYHSELII